MLDRRRRRSELPGERPVAEPVGSARPATPSAPAPWRNLLLVTWRVTRLVDRSDADLVGTVEGSSPRSMSSISASSRTPGTNTYHLRRASHDAQGATASARRSGARRRRGGALVRRREPAAPSSRPARRAGRSSVPRTSDQKKAPSPNTDMSESAIANAKSGPRTSGPAAIAFRAADERRDQRQPGHREQQHRRHQHRDLGGGAGEERDRQAGHDRQVHRPIADVPVAGAPVPRRRGPVGARATPGSARRANPATSPPRSPR